MIPAEYPYSMLVGKTVGSASYVEPDTRSETQFKPFLVLNFGDGLRLEIDADAPMRLIAPAETWEDHIDSLERLNEVGEV